METRSRSRYRQELLEDREAALQRIAEHEQAIKRIREEIARARQSYKATLEELNVLKAQLKSAEDDLVSTEQLQCSLKFVMEQSFEWFIRLGEKLQQSSSEKS